MYARELVLALHCIENDKSIINEVAVDLDDEEGIYFIDFITLKNLRKILKFLKPQLKRTIQNVTKINVISRLEMKF